MALPFQTRPERLAAERRAKYEAERAALDDAKGSLNPKFPYRVIPCDAGAFKARPLWRQQLET